MGLTIYYSFASDVESDEEAANLLELLHQKALSLKFVEVSSPEWVGREEVVELKEEVERVQFGGPAFFLGQASCMAKDPALLESLGEHGYHSVEPDCFHHFHVFPGQGCETAPFGLARMPEATQRDGETWQTGLQRWGWQSFCKTQYASNAKFGGADHFMRCHLGLIELLDYADELGILDRVGDDSGYWEHRDAAKLHKSVEEMNRIVASFTGAFKDAMGTKAGTVIAPITDFPDFEHLEADGRLRDSDTGELENE